MAVHVSRTFLISKFKDFFYFIQRRYRVKTKWATTRAKFPATALALQNFDATYSKQLGDVWPSVRVGMLSEQKYGALMNTFASPDDAISDLHSRGCRDFISVASSSDDGKNSHELLQKSELHNHAATVDTFETATACTRISSNIQCLVFPRGDISRFKPARPGNNGLLGYYLLDAASVLPVLALDVQPGHTVLDLCAGPGGKTLAILQSQAVRFLWANDLAGSRTARLRRTLQSYLPKEILRIIHITSFDGRNWRNMDCTFDRVLVDVPCTTDRHSLMEEENNIFKRARTKERQKLPLLQTELLLAGIQATRPGGEVVYSTCSLSHLQNECVVEQAISVARREMGITLHVQDLGSFIQIFSGTFHFAPQTATGVLVLPHLCANFGPTYMCKLQRVS
ncbi:5-methylcytosine rRNA methyltransferase NSUN4 [Electrophorus electricus]|uniref:5-cytosine rRNA methyltransferase NSUN4 n=1 Tax=Electrophorus electricus TaxID=8005 RepID=A0A4W4FLI4_ELEEL|nr:5-methylcytosine rRNA methyltransferase NSUN4 [Electrophorus electricus]